MPRKRPGDVSFWIGLFAILAPGLFLIGRMYQFGTLDTFGVASEIFEKSTQATYLDAYLAFGLFLNNLSKYSSQLLVQILSSWIVLIFLLVVIVGVILKKFFKTSLYSKLQASIKAFREYGVRLWSESDFLKVASISSLVFNLIFVVLSLLVSLAVFWWFIPIQFYNIGVEEAKRNITEYNSLGCCASYSNGYSYCSTFIDNHGTVLVEGLVVASNQSYIAFFNGTETITKKIEDGQAITRNKVSKDCRAHGDIEGHSNELN